MASIEFKGGGKLKAKLQEIASRTGKAKSLKVGFMSDADYPDGTKVAMVAAIQNFGAPAAGIPPRPFFSNMVKAKSPRWGESLGNMLERTDFDGEKALNLMGEGIKGQLQRSINETNEPALSPVTVAKKGFDKALIDTANMIRAASYVVEGDTE
jgi:hypothetical protein